MESLSTSPEKSRPPVTSTAGDKLKVVVVEDDFLVSLSVSEAIELAGMEVVATAATAGQAVALCETERPDLVTIDLNLCGDLVGIEVAEVLREQLDVPIIFVTAFNSPEIREAGDKSSPLCWIEKPFTPRVMAERLKAVTSSLH
ncbi:response regulator [Parvularcula marina]|uniref:Response regulator n=1 Tax=Parvularcula marina TaxID=2292771 RepID=A0A371R7W6_9PROT|nr:response regulator [Parvularcula marina]